MVVTIILWIVSWWNVENLLDTRHDSFSRYQNKVEHIAQVICNMGGWEQPVLVGLGEVENDTCLYSLCRALVQFPYRPVHFDSPDERGIDVALLYDTTRFSLLSAEPLRVDLGEDATRDILAVSGILSGTADTLFCFFCHLPSMRGGAAASEWKRDRAKAVVQRRVDSILAVHPCASIIVMGDMNCAPKNDLRGLTNATLPLAQKGEGTHFYHGQWAYLDQCYLSPVMAARTTISIYRPSWLLVPDKEGLDSVPHRTGGVFHYDRTGYSDHLPLLLTW